MVGFVYLPRDREDGVAELDYCFLGSSYPHLAVTIRNGCGPTCYFCILANCIVIASFVKSHFSIQKFG